MRKSIFSFVKSRNPYFLWLLSLIPFIIIFPLLDGWKKLFSRFIVFFVSLALIFIAIHTLSELQVMGVIAALSLINAYHVYALALDQKDKPLSSFFKWAFTFVLSVTTFFGFNYVKSNTFILASVENDAMAPRFQAGDFIFFYSPKIKTTAFSRGEVVLFKRANSNALYVSRIMGMPQENIKYSQERITILGQNEELNPDQLVANLNNANTINLSLPKEQGVSLKENQFFMVGDNRNQSHDSRHFGAVKEENIIGRANFIYYNRIEKSIKFEKMHHSLKP